jgi:adenine-specific DNA-methyltransferase
MEQLIADKKILWPKDSATVTYGSLSELLAAIDAGTAPRNLRRDVPDLEFWIGKTIGFGKPRYKRHLAEVRRSEKPLSSWLIPNAAKKEELASQTDDATESLRSGYTSDGTSLVQDMLNNKDFPYPKPLSLVKALLAQATGPGDLVVDFFAGSGTTGHAVLALNAEDGGERRFILVSSTEATAAEPQKNVCRDITQRRMAAAVNGYTVHTKKGFKSVAGLGGGFAYLRARRVPLEGLADLPAEQVWLAVALFHLGVVPANTAADAGWYAAVSETAGVAYLPRVDRDSAAALRRHLARAEAPTVVYTHQVSALRQRLGLPDAEILPVPATIAARFGLEVTP